MEDDLRRRSVGSVRIKDEDRLAELGYKQELKRNWSLLHNFGVSFSIIVRPSPSFSVLKKRLSNTRRVISWVLQYLLDMSLASEVQSL